MGFAYSQLKQFDKAIEKFSLAIEASKDTDDLCSHWQANEGLAAVYFLKRNHKKAVDHYKTALSSLSSSGALTKEHNDRIINKLADAMRFLYTHTDFSPVQKKKRSTRRRKTRKHERDSDEGSKKVGKTRPRTNTHHKLIARGIDGQFVESTESDTSEDLSESFSTDESDSEQESKGKRLHKKTERKAKTSSNPMLLLSGPYQNLIKNGDKSLTSSEFGDGYEEPSDGKIINGTGEVTESRAHKEAYLASLATATSTPKKSPPTQDDTWNSDNKGSNQSKMCAIQ